MQYAFALAGAEVERVHVNQLITGARNLKDYHILALPGGFSFGDDIGAGKVLATKFKYNLQESLQQFIADGKLIIGICNGFQVMVKLGILPGMNGDYRSQQVTLTFNDSSRFEDRWVYLDMLPSKCVFTRDIERIYLPVRHGEGKFIPKDKTILQKLYQNNQIVAKYVDPAGNQNPVFPWNPNGSVDSIAAICDATGRIFGMMPHPEAHLSATNNPSWARTKAAGNALPAAGMGLQIFQNAVKYVRDN